MAKYFFATNLVGFRSTTLRVQVRERRAGHTSGSGPQTSSMPGRDWSFGTSKFRRRRDERLPSRRGGGIKSAALHAGSCFAT